MRCGRCKADVMLGSAQCAKCGASVLDATMPDAPRSNPSMIGTAWVPPPPGAMDPNIGLAGVAVPTLPPPPPDAAPGGAPPPPPPPPPTQHRPPIKVERARRAAPAGQAAKAKVGCGGCLGPLVAIGIVGLVLTSVGRSVVDDVGDALDGGGRVDGPAVVLGEPIRFEIGSDDTGVHALLATTGGPATVSVEAVGDFDPRVRVVEVGGAELGSDDDGGEDRDSLLSVVLDEGRSYEVEVEEFSGDAGEYVLLVSSAVTEGAAVGRASQVEGSVDPGETARHPFTGPGGEITVRVVGRDGFDPMLAIRDAAGNELGANDDADGRDSRLTLAVPLDVAVVIEVKGFNDAGGAYTVVVD